ncbi:MAG: beta-galactosidase, partial [Mycobacterium sp.]|nr:beta-galactosidase [Mycobacterium sp.]
MGRVGALAVALGIGVAIVNGAGPAVADTPSSEASSESESGPAGSNSTAPESDPAVADTAPTGATPADTVNDAAPEPDSATDAANPSGTASTSTGGTTSAAPPGVVVSTGGAQISSSKDADDEPVDEPKSTSGSDQEAASAAVKVDAVSKVDATEVKVDGDARPAVEQESDARPASSLAARTMSTMTVQSAVTTAVTEPVVPSLRPWPTAFDPVTVVTYVSGLVTGFVNALLSPFASGLPALPTDPSPWALLAWVRRELFNGSPSITPVVNPQTNGLITGNIGAVDADGDQLTYTVIGRPLNGGTLEVDEDGNFTYRPMNAMAAVGGTDQFTVVVSDEAAGFHVHGPLGLLKLVPILGNFINPGGGDAVAQTITVSVDPVAGVDLSFPSTFHWGVATAGFQAEGGPGSPVDPNSDWYKWVHDPINQLLGLTHGVPENGPGTYVSYDGDAALAEGELGMNTFRMSIEWSRLFPNSTASVDISDEGGGVSEADLHALDALANQDEVDHYSDVLDSL